MGPLHLQIRAGFQTLRFPNNLKPDERKSIDDLAWVKALAVIAIVIGGIMTLLSALAMTEFFTG